MRAYRCGFVIRGRRRQIARRHCIGPVLGAIVRVSAVQSLASGGVTLLSFTRPGSPGMTRAKREPSKIYETGMKPSLKPALYAVD